MTLPLSAPDLACVDDLDLFAAETTSDLETLEQDVYHTLIETLGSNLDAPARGLGLEELLSGPDTNLADIAKRIESELLKDDRVDAVSATITPGTDRGSYELELDVTVGTEILGLSYAATRAGGLVPA